MSSISRCPGCGAQALLGATTTLRNYTPDKGSNQGRPGGQEL